MKCVILQPSYIPWRGYFHQIALSDIFVFYDDVQYDKRGWRNRNMIKTAAGLKWLTIPVHSKGAQTENIPIKEIPIVWEKPWNDEHLKTIYHAYKSAPYYDYFYDFLQNSFSIKMDYLADFTCNLTQSISEFLGITGKIFLRSSSLKTTGSKTEKLIQILKMVGADHYISGPSAKNYIDNQLFENEKISLEYMKYDYREYPQLYHPFEGGVSIIDLIFMTGPDALNYIIK